MIKPNEYYKGFCIRDVCHAVKTKKREEAVRYIADWYVNTGEIDGRCTLIPVPQHTGKAEYTLEICQLIQKSTGCYISDVLRSIPHKSLYEQKRKQSKQLYTGLYNIGNIVTNQRVFLIDNVVATGLTMKDCVELIPSAIPFAFAEVR